MSSAGGSAGGRQVAERGWMFTRTSRSSIRAEAARMWCWRHISLPRHWRHDEMACIARKTSCRISRTAATEHTDPEVLKAS